MDGRSIVSWISLGQGQIRAGTRLAVGSCPSGSLDEVEIHPAGQRVGDDERRGSQVVRLDLRVDARLEVAVSREHGTDDQVAVRDGLAIASGSGPELPMQVVQP